MTTIMFCRKRGRAYLRGPVKSARVHFGRGNANVLFAGFDADIPTLNAMGIAGCTRVIDKCDAFFPRVRMRSMLDALGATMDVVVRVGHEDGLCRELEFVCALIEWGCGPLPELDVLDAYDRGYAIASIDAETRIRTATALARASAESDLARVRDELHSLRETVERQRREIAARPADEAALARAERQRAADVEIVEGLRNRWASDVSSLSSEREIERARGRVDAAYLIATELREREVVR